MQHEMKQEQIIIFEIQRNRVVWRNYGGRMMEKRVNFKEVAIKSIRDLRKYIESLEDHEVPIIHAFTAKSMEKGKEGHVKVKVEDIFMSCYDNRKKTSFKQVMQELNS